MKTIRYFDILKRALIMTWNNKFLWFFGLLITISTLASNVGMNIVAISEKNADLQAVGNFIQSNLGIYAVSILILITALIGFFILRLIGVAGIIKSANDIVVYKQSKLAAIFSEAKQYIWQLFWLEILVNVALGAVIFVLFIPVAYLFILKASVLASIALVVAVLISVFLLVLAYYLRRYAFFYIIIGNMRTRMALESAYALFKKNIRESLLMGCASIAAGTIILMIFLILSMIPIVAVTKVVFLLILFSWYASFGQAVWTLFFQEIYLEKKPEKSIAEKMESTEEIPSPEAI